MEARVRFGPAGWSYPDWVGPVYARGERQLELVASAFDVVEVNSSFYRIPAPALVRAWPRRVAHNPAFRFTVKLWQGFTHGREHRLDDVTSFRAAIDPILEAEKLGALLMQFPWRVKYGDAARRHLDRLLADFRGLPVAVEFRHGSWDRAEVRAGLGDRGAAFCNIDQPLLSGGLAPGEWVTAEHAYVRLHGRNATDWFRQDAGRDRRYDYRYSEAELRPWAERLGRIASAARKVYVITNNHFGGSAVANALELRHLFDGSTPEVPARWIERFTALGRFCRPRPSGHAGPFQADLFRATGA